MATHRHADILEVVHPGLGASLQDRGRVGWRRCGIPRSGAMDTHASDWANRLLNNPPSAPVIELYLHGGQFRILQSVWLAVTGADGESEIPTWRAVKVHEGDVIHFPRQRCGSWTYLAVEGGFAGTRHLGSVSACPRAGIGRMLQKGDILGRDTDGAFQLPGGVAGRIVTWSEQRDYYNAPTLRVWPGPQWDWFAPSVRRQFFSQAWVVTPQSDRAGYRLKGKSIMPPDLELISEPVRVGSIQIPAGGQPIVTLRDGPTIGECAKLGMIDPADLDWFVQCQPYQRIRFASQASRK